MIVHSYRPQIVDELLRGEATTFTLDLAASASRRDVLNLEQWLTDSVAAQGGAFLIAIAEFLSVKMESEKATRISSPAVEQRSVPLSPQMITVYLRILRVK